MARPFADSGAIVTPTPTWLFTCRHTHEHRLVDELSRPGFPGDPHPTPHPTIPGLVVVENLPAAPDAAVLAAWDPVWALQVLPAAELLTANSINGLARAIADRLASQLDTFAGAWRLQVVLSGELKGQVKPRLGHRKELLNQAISERLQRTRRRAWRRHDPRCHTPEWIAQVLIEDVEHVWLSMTPTLRLPTGGTWPSALPAGLADVADDPIAPSSAFRKLEEAFACIGRWPQPGELAVDLGASPGGWTRVLLRHGAQVTAVDRAPLTAHLMTAPNLCWLGGDAFTFKPDVPVQWLVSDVIAYPQRVAELLDVWCGERLAERMVVQMKFTGATDWQALDTALQTARKHGFAARAKHFFNDKNEVTLMLRASAPAS